MLESYRQIASAFVVPSLLAVAAWANEKGSNPAGVEKTARDVLARFDKTDPGLKVRFEALVKLVRTGRHVVPALVDALEKGSPTKRAFAAEALTVFADPSTRQALQNALKNTSPQVRIHAIRALSMLGRLKPTEEPYRTLVEKDSHYRVRWAMAWAFEQDDGSAEAALARKRLRAYNPALVGTARLDDPAPDFSLTDVFGKTYRLSDYRGKKAVLLKFYNEPQ